MPDPDETDSATAVSNTATAHSDEVGDTSGADTVDIVEDVHLSVTKTFSSLTATAGGAPQTFTIDVHNSGVSDADNVKLTDTVEPPDGLGHVFQEGFRIIHRSWNNL